MERKKFLKLSMLLVVMVMMLFVKPEKVLATSDAIFDSTITTGSLTITKKKEADNTAVGDKETIAGVEYSLYKIADIEQKNDNGTVQLYYEIDTTVINSNTDIPSAGDIGDDMTLMNTEAETIYAALIDSTKTTAKNTTNENGVVEFTGLPLGVYLVYESGRPAGAAVGQSFIVTIPMTQDNGTTWSYNLEATPKNTITEIALSKSIWVGDGNDDTTPIDDNLVKSADYQIGDTITYRIEAEVPAGVGDLAYYYIEDKPADGITVDLDAADGNVTVYGIKSDGSYVTLTKSTDYDVTDTRIYFATTKIADYTKLYIDIKATLNTDAEIGTDSGNENKAEIWYSATTTTGSTTPDNTSSTDGLESVTDLTGETPKVYTFGIDLKKELEGSESTIDLSGVKFELLDENENAVKVALSEGVYCLDSTSSTNEVVTDASGEIKIKGLSSGIYYLKETETKSGYTLLKEPIAIVITEKSNGSTSNMTVETTINDTTTNEGDDGYFTFTVLNKKGFTLPSTGGRGIYIFTITGLLIMAGAVVLMVKNKKKSK